MNTAIRAGVMREPYRLFFSDLRLPGDTTVGGARWSHVFHRAGSAFSRATPTAVQAVPLRGLTFSRAMSYQALAESHSTIPGGRCPP